MRSGKLYWDKYLSWCWKNDSLSVLYHFRERSLRSVLLLPLLFTSKNLQTTNIAGALLHNDGRCQPDTQYRH